MRRHVPVDALDPSPTLKKFVGAIVREAPGPILDIPCGYGRNALPFAEQGFDVYCVDIDQDALASIAALHTVRSVSGRLIPIAADLSAGPPAPLVGQRFGAIINIHYVCQHLVQWWTRALMVGGFLYVETFDNRGGNFWHLPKAQQFRELLSDEFRVIMYREMHAGPASVDAVTVRLLAQKVR